MYEVEKKYNRDDARANLKSEPRADIPFLRYEYTPPLPNDDNGVRERTHQSGKLPLAYLQVGKKQRNVYVPFGFSKIIKTL